VESYVTSKLGYKHVTADPEIELSARGKKLRAEARPVNSQKLADVTNSKLDVTLAVTI